MWTEVCTFLAFSLLSIYIVQSKLVPHSYTIYMSMDGNVIASVGMFVSVAPRGFTIYLLHPPSFGFVVDRPVCELHLLSYPLGIRNGIWSENSNGDRHVDFS